MSPSSQSFYIDSEEPGYHDRSLQWSTVHNTKDGLLIPAFCLPILSPWQYIYTQSYVLQCCNNLLCAL